MAIEALRKTQTDGQRLREAIDTEYRAARRDGSWGRSEPQILERWRLALRAWGLAVEAALGADEAAVGRFRAAPASADRVAGESAAWLEVRNVVAGKLAALGRLIEERGQGPSAPTSPSPFRKR
ncbi:MAG TPA: hypothetical protein VFE48_10525 [Methylomirabilota bacterium]|nr:hypothetical protein [Methylomirabilota bacterium]